MKWLTLPAFVSPQGPMRPQACAHFVHRHKLRFGGIEPKDLAAHVARTMMKCKVIHGPQVGRPETDYYLVDEDNDRIMVMQGYLGVLMTCYSASRSMWFKPLGCHEKEWPGFAQVFGEPENQLELLGSNHMAKLGKVVEKRKAKQEQDYLQWYESKRG